MLILKTLFMNSKIKDPSEQKEPQQQNSTDMQPQQI